MARDNGFKKYQTHFERDPSIVVEWHDRETDAVGWLCIDSLHGGAAGGGTRMTPGGTREEAVFLAKAMAIKFRVCGPSIGGGKSVIRFDYKANPKAKRGVLERWYAHIGPYLKNCYGTGGDVGVDEVSEATAITNQVIGLEHPQEGIARGHGWNDTEGPAPKLARLKHGVEARVSLPGLPGPRDGGWMIADVITGYGVARSLERYYTSQGKSLEGERMICEGFGAVGAFAAYYLALKGVRLVATSTRIPGGTYRVAVNQAGLDVNALIASRDGTNLPKPAKGQKDLKEAKNANAMYGVEAEIFVPAAVSHTLGKDELDAIKSCGVKVIAPGANNPFAYNPRHDSVKKWVKDMLKLQTKADKRFAVIPDFIANSGMARTFGYLMAAGASTDAQEILADCDRAMDSAMDKLLKKGDAKSGLLERAYSTFVPE